MSLVGFQHCSNDFLKHSNLLMLPTVDRFFSPEFGTNDSKYVSTLYHGFLTVLHHHLNFCLLFSSILSESKSICIPCFPCQYGWWKKSCTSWCGKYPTTCRVSYMSGGAGFLPYTVSEVERFDLTANRWQTLQPLRTPRMATGERLLFPQE